MYYEPRRSIVFQWQESPVTMGSLALNAAVRQREV